MCFLASRLQGKVFRNTAYRISLLVNAGLPFSVLSVVQLCMNQMGTPDLESLAGND